MANRAVLIVAAICTATMARADTFAERWPAPSAINPVQVAQGLAAELPEKVRQAFACHRIYFTQNKHRYGHACDETSARAVHHCSRMATAVIYPEPEKGRAQLAFDPNVRASASLGLRRRRRILGGRRA